MRHLRLTIGLALTMSSLALAAAPAMASEFVSSGGHSKGKGGEQEFNLGPFKIICKKAKSSGGEATPTNSETYFTEVRFQQCKTVAHIGANPIYLKTRFITPIAIEYHANGFVELGSEGEEIEGVATLIGGEVELRIHSIKCKINLPEQTVPRKAIKDPDGSYTAAKYETVPGNNGKNKLLIENNFKGIHYEYGEGQCAGFKTSEEERSQGRYTGELLEEVPMGNLEYQP